MIEKEFDNYIDNYRNNCNNALWLSGESSDYFALYKAQKLQTWFSNQTQKKIKILDFGCGDGIMTQHVQSLFPHATVYGVDPSPKSVQDAQTKFPSIKFSVNSDSNTKLDFESNSFDLIFTAGTLHHIPFSMHAGYMQELMRIVKAGGSIVIFELNPLNPLTVYTFKTNPIDYNAKMLTPWYAYNLAKKYSKPSIKFICFFPKFLKFLRPLEALFSKIPAGALYSIIIPKKGAD
ncbi:MAG: class I SAM-dependent methyltransferase [Candidatus Babeliales bacterium]